MTTKYLSFSEDAAPMAYTREAVTDHKNCSIVQTIKQFRDAYCLYSIHSNAPHHINKDNPATPFFVGVCKLRDVMLMVDAFRNTKFREVTDDDQLMLTILHTCNNETELQNLRMSMIKTFRPIANVVGYTEQSSRSVITCTYGVLEGVTFPTQAEAARRCGLSQGAISNHLNNTPGYEIIKGYKFKRGLP
jgi:hypothetical protein